MARESLTPSCADGYVVVAPDYDAVRAGPPELASEF